MKKLSKFALIIISLLATALIICGCGAESLNNTTDNVSKNSFQALGEDNEIKEEAGSAENVNNARKIIEYVNYSVETKAFDKLIADINTIVNKSDGYLESSEIGGNGFDEFDNRTAEITVRIPKSKKADFSDFLAENSNIVNSSVNTEDVTDRYIDTESRIKALKIEKETLEKLLAKTSNVSDTMAVYEKLTDVISEIESYQGELNQLDNKIEYTTFNIFIEEVNKETVTQRQNWFIKTKNDLLDNLSDVGNGLLSFLSFIIAGLPYWILICVIAVIIILIVRRIKKKSDRIKKQADIQSEEK